MDCVPPVDMFFRVEGFNSTRQSAIIDAIRQLDGWLYQGVFPAMELKWDADRGWRLEGWGMVTQDYWDSDENYRSCHIERVENAIIQANSGIRPPVLEVRMSPDYDFWDYRD